MTQILQKIKSLLVRTKSKIRSLFIRLILLTLIFIALTFFLNIFSYFDPFSFCYIGIDNDMLKGNQSSIKKAISLIKKSDKESYKVLCKYIDTISESHCARWGGLEGCYLRGSKVILIIPTKDQSGFTIAKRAEMIKKYAYFSKKFWENRQD